MVLGVGKKINDMKTLSLPSVVDRSVVETFHPDASLQMSIPAFIQVKNVLHQI